MNIHILSKNLRVEYLALRNIRELKATVDKSLTMLEGEKESPSLSVKPILRNGEDTRWITLRI